MTHLGAPLSRREQLATATFVDLADTLAGDYDVVEFLHTLVERCQSVLGVTTGGVLLEGPEGRLRLIASTSEAMQRLEQAELDHEEGPCLDAYRDVEQVTSGDLREERHRWPQVVDHAVDMGLLAVHAFPLRLRGDCIGALNLYRDAPGGFGDEDIRLAQAFADVAAIGILQERRVAAAERRAGQLQHALDSRVLVEQAKGAVAERHGLDMQAAFDLLRRHARNHNRKLRDVCRAVIDGATLDEAP